MEKLNDNMNKSRDNSFNKSKTDISQNDLNRSDLSDKSKSSNIEKKKIFDTSGIQNLDQSPKSYSPNRQ